LALLDGSGDGDHEMPILATMIIPKAEWPIGLSTLNSIKKDELVAKFNDQVDICASNHLIRQAKNEQLANRFKK
jgi:hypothetical protein